jgi:hypothetical protein
MRPILYFCFLATILGTGCEFGPEPIPIHFDLRLSGDTLASFKPFSKVQIRDAVQLKNKDIILGGEVQLISGKFDGIVIRVSNQGTIKEILQLDSNSGDDLITSMAMDEDENIYLGGRQRDINVVHKGLIFKVSTAGSLTKTWHKIYDFMQERLTYKIIYKEPKLFVMRSALSGPGVFQGQSGYFSLDTSGVVRSCQKTLGYYDMLSYVRFQDKVVFGGLSGLAQDPWTEPMVSIIKPSDCAYLKNRSNFNAPHNGIAFSYLAALDIGPEGYIYGIMNRIDAGRNTFFHPYFVQLASDTSLAFRNTNTMNTRLDVDTTQVQGSCGAMVSGSDGSFIFAMNYINGNEDQYRTDLLKRNAYFPDQRMWKTLTFDKAHTSKLVKLPDSKYLIICGNATHGQHRIIRVDSKGEIE